MINNSKFIPTITVIIWVLVVLSSCQNREDVTTELSFSGSPGTGIPIKVRTKPEPEVKGLVKWTCNGITVNEMLRFFPDDGSNAWDFKCNNNDAIPNKFSGHPNWTETTLVISGTLLIPRDQTPKTISGSISGYVRCAYITSSRWDPTRRTDTFSVAHLAIKHRLTVTVAAPRTPSVDKQ